MELPVSHEYRTAIIFGRTKHSSSVIFYNRKIILIRPKMWLANGVYPSRDSDWGQWLTFASSTDGNYREMRHFTPWQRPREVEDYYLEQIVGKITGQYKVPFGDALISTRDTCLGLETCEELFTPNG